LAQTGDISEGRRYDGDPLWTTFTTPTPGATNTGGTAVPELDGTVLRLLPNAPDPFNPLTTLRFVLSVSARVQLEIFDVRGRRVVELVNGRYPAGEFSVNWSGRDSDGRNLASGAYYARLTGQGQIDTERLLLVR